MAHHACDRPPIAKRSAASVPVRARRRNVLVGLVLIFAIGVTAPSSAASASSLPACAPGSETPPTVTISDLYSATAQLTATHPIEALWNDQNSGGTLLLHDYSVSPPFVMNDTDATFVPANAGNYTFGLAWQQEPLQGPANPCVGSLTQAITVGPATRPRFSPIQFSFDGALGDRATDLTWTLNTGSPRLNLGLVTAEFRAVGRDQLPTSRTPKHTLRYPLCDCDPLFGKVHNPRVVRVGPVRMTPIADVRIRFQIRVEVSTTHVTRFGYDLVVRQGSYQLGRLRVAGTCHFSGGFSNCKLSHLPKPER
jgi:hypothetical protein